MKPKPLFSRLLSTVMIVLIVPLFLTNCTTTKKLEKSSLNSTVATDLNVTKTTDDKQAGSATDQSVKIADKKTDSSETKNKTIETHTTDFDSSKPIVPGTNKPPVIKETIRYIRESNQKDVQIQETLTDRLNLQISYTRGLQQKVDSLLKENSSLSSKTETKETPVTNWWKWLLVGVIIGLIAMFFIRKIPFIAIWIKIKAFLNRNPDGYRG